MLILESQITKTVHTMMNGLTLISNKLAKEITKFLLNITIGQEVKDLGMLVDDGLSISVLDILNTNKTNTALTTKSIAIRAAQNLLSAPRVGLKLAKIWLKPLLKFLHDVPTDIGMIYLYQ